MDRAGSFPLARIMERLAAAGALAPGASAPGEVGLCGVSHDSRKVGEGDLFVAWRGAEHDGHDFVGEAARRGAVAALVETPLPEVPVPQVAVLDGRLAGALAADEFFGNPCRDLFVYAVTGTNGKTTTTLLARHLLRAGGASAAIGTLGLVDAGGEVRPRTVGLTTPGPVQLSAWIRSLADAGVRHVGLEASSHALDQRRLDGVQLDAVAYTNLSRDHLDYHPDMDGYRAAKARAVGLVVPEGTVVVNADEPAWVRLESGSRNRLSYGVDSAAALTATSLELGPAGTRFELSYEGSALPVSMPLLGRFNVENALAAAGIALAAGRRVDEVVDGTRKRARGPGTHGTRRQPPVPGGHRLRAYPRRAGLPPRHPAAPHRRPAHRPLRGGRGSRRRQASPDGQGGGGAGRSGHRHLGQPAHRGPGGDHRPGDRGGWPGRSTSGIPTAARPSGERSTWPRPGIWWSSRGRGTRPARSSAARSCPFDERRIVLAHLAGGEEGA